MRCLDIIMKKRDGKRLSKEEIDALVAGYTNGSVPDYQMSAFLMAVFFRGMDAGETSLLTSAMLGSGKTIYLDSVRGIAIDKHSTGGVGDKVSLVLAPLAAACGLVVPMMSGRGLGHTGGTLDKLEAIPGYRTDLSEARFTRALRDIGFAMISASEEVAPADRLMYALRDVTATVESIPLITASILSKKCAEGASGFVFDVKCGSGAFMKSIADARSLAGSLVATSREMGRKAVAVITDMSEPLGFAVGNACEVEEAVACLTGKGPEDVMEVTIRLTAYMLLLGDVCATLDEAEELCMTKLGDGSAFAKFADNVEYQGGDPDFVTGKKRMKSSALEKPLYSPDDGYVAGIDAYSIGLAAVTLGAGRARKEDNVLPHAGIILRKKTGDAIHGGEELARLYADDDLALDRALALVRSAYSLSKAPTGRAGSKIIEEMVE
jgi:pyrimidine-nucleoside phosphorylase